MRKLLLQLVTGPTTKCLDYSSHELISLNSVTSAVEYFLHVLHDIFQISTHTSKGRCIFSRKDFDNREEFGLLMIQIFTSIVCQRGR